VIFAVSNSMHVLMTLSLALAASYQPMCMMTCLTTSPALSYQVHALQDYALLYMYVPLCVGIVPNASMLINAVSYMLITPVHR